jgi:hypothetical protein
MSAKDVATGTPSNPAMMMESACARQGRVSWCMFAVSLDGASCVTGISRLVSNPAAIPVKCGSGLPETAVGRKENLEPGTGRMRDCGFQRLVRQR